MLKKIKKDLEKAGNKKQAKLLQRFFKTGPGEYGEGDIFLGIKVPVQRTICKAYYDLDLNSIQSLLSSKIHEERLCALFILIEKYKKCLPNCKGEDKIAKFYIRNVKAGRINNWDLIDLSAPNILGTYLLDKPRDILYKLAKSKNLWEKRVAIISTMAFIKIHDFKDAIKISEILLKDRQDLIHKAVGWVLREIGKKDEKVLLKFLDKHYKEMPRTMLRYSLEKLSEKKRKFFMKK